ncbi:MAG: SpoIID/LytB domain-containing protein, partial [Planctomycetota bacterium]
MKPTERQPLRKVLIPLLPLCLIVASAGLAGSLTSCSDGPDVQLKGPHDIASQPVPLGPDMGDSPLPGPPEVRVRLLSRPVQTVRIGCTGAATMTADDRPLFASETRMPQLNIARQGGAWTIATRTLEADRLELTGADGQFLQVMVDGKMRAYRGRIRLAATGAESMEIINLVDMDSYVAGVLAEELYGSWHIEAYRALAIAARSHAWYFVLRGGRGNWDVNDDTSSQVYGGIEAETSKSRAAAAETAGQVLTYTFRGQRMLFLAHYSSSCGGRVNPAEAIRPAAAIPPLIGGGVCNDCNQPGNRKHRWAPVTVEKARIFRALVAHDRKLYAPLSVLREIRVTRATRWGRPIWLRLIGSGQITRDIRADDLRLVLIQSLPEAKGLYSMNCRLIDRGLSVEFTGGGGFGHGVG